MNTILPNGLPLSGDFLVEMGDKPLQLQAYALSFKPYIIQPASCFSSNY